MWGITLLAGIKIGPARTHKRPGQRIRAAAGADTRGYLVQNHPPITVVVQHVQDAARISGPCLVGMHQRCLGTVHHVFGNDEPCACPVCNHEDGR
jgi:hypothetical protein